MFLHTPKPKAEWHGLLAHAPPETLLRAVLSLSPLPTRSLLSLPSSPECPVCVPLLGSALLKRQGNS